MQQHVVPRLSRGSEDDAMSAPSDSSAAALAKQNKASPSQLIHAIPNLGLCPNADQKIQKFLKCSSLKQKQKMLLSTSTAERVATRVIQIQHTDRHKQRLWNTPILHSRTLLSHDHLLSNMRTGKIHRYHPINFDNKNFKHVHENSPKLNTRDSEFFE